jgi:hypothetical protein
MFWALILITLLPINTPNGTYSTYYVVSQHENRIECENELSAFTEKPGVVNKNQKAVCIKTDEFLKRFTSSTH